MRTIVLLLQGASAPLPGVRAKPALRFLYLIEALQLHLTCAPVKQSSVLPTV